MSSIERTAWPRYSTRRKIKQQELCQYYTLTKNEAELMKRVANKSHSRLNFAIQLKTFQRLGYFIEVYQVPYEIIQPIKKSLKLHHRLKIGYSSKTTCYAHRNKIRQYMKVLRWGGR